MRDKHSNVCIRMGLTHLHIQSYLSFLVAVMMALTKEISTRGPLYRCREWQEAVFFTTFFNTAMRYCAVTVTLTMKHLSPAFQPLSTESRHDADPTITALSLWQPTVLPMAGTMATPGTQFVFLKVLCMKWHGIDYSSITWIKWTKNHLMFIIYTQQYGFQTKKYTYLTHCRRVTHICVSKLTIIGSYNQWLATWPAPSHYLNPCCSIVNWTFRNKLQWYLNRILYIFIQEKAFENVVWKMATIMSRPQCVNLE